MFLNLNKNSNRKIEIFSEKYIKEKFPDAKDIKIKVKKTKNGIYKTNIAIKTVRKKLIAKKKSRRLDESLNKSLMALTNQARKLDDKNKKLKLKRKIGIRELLNKNIIEYS